MFGGAVHSFCVRRPIGGPAALRQKLCRQSLHVDARVLRRNVVGRPEQRGQPCRSFRRRTFLAGTVAALARRRLGHCRRTARGRRDGRIYRYKIGKLRVTALYDGIW